MFKLARSWTSFKELLHKIVLSIKEVYNFLVLLTIMMFIFALLGMELYGEKVFFTEEGFMLEGLSEEVPTPPRPNFNNFYMAITTILIIFIGEDWHTVMHSHYRVEGFSALVFFPVVYIILHLIMMNLFLAILLQSFETAEQEKEESLSEEKALSRFKRHIK